MSAALAPSPPAVSGPPGLTLEDRLEGVLDEGRERGEAPCPLCGAAMASAAGELRCSGCGSRLS